MSSDINIIVLGGRLGTMPERRGEGPVVFRLASNRWVPGREGTDGREETSWLSITCWGSLAERVLAQLATGTPVLVEGRLQVRSWEDSETGQRREGCEVVASAVHRQDGRSAA